VIGSLALRGLWGVACGWHRSAGPGRAGRSDELPHAPEGQASTADAEGMEQE